LGQAKLAIYISRKNKIEQQPGQSINEVFLRLVRSRVLIDFNFYKTMQDLSTFKMVWCSYGALCVVSEDELVFCL